MLLCLRLCTYIDKQMSHPPSHQRQQHPFSSSGFAHGIAVQSSTLARPARIPLTHHSFVYLGNFLSKSPNLSSGAANKLATVSNGGLSGTRGWLRVGTNIFVRWKLEARVSDDSFAMTFSSAFSRAGRSWSSSSRTCLSRSLTRDSRVVVKEGDVGDRDWNSWSSCMIYEFCS